MSKANKKQKDHFTKRIGCSSDTDVFTLDKLPKNLFDILVLNNKKPYHCAEIESFYSYWKSEANEGRKVKNPFTLKEIPDKQLTKLFAKIKRKYPDDQKPVVLDGHVEHGWDADGRQTREVIDHEEQREAHRAVEAQRVQRVQREQRAQSDENDGNFRIWGPVLERRLRTREDGATLEELLHISIGNPINNEWYNQTSQEIHSALDRMVDGNYIDLNNGRYYTNRELNGSLIRDLFPEQRQVDYWNTNSNNNNLEGGGRKKKQKKNKSKKVRKHQGINQQTGRLNKGYKYSGKLKSGLSKIVKVISKK